MKPGDFFEKLTGTPLRPEMTLTQICQAVEAARGHSERAVPDGVWPVDTQTTSADLDRRLAVAFSSFPCLRR